MKRTRKATTAEPKQTVRDQQSFEDTLRPQTLSDYVGQPQAKEHLSVHMQAAKTRKEPLGHTLLHGPPGLGKTTLAQIVGREMGAQIRLTTGPAIEKPGDLAAMLTHLSEGDILFIDEIHRMRPVVEEVLYSAMEDFALDLVIGKGPTARSMRLDIPPFTLVGATTKVGSMSAPLRDRFVHTFKLQFYSIDEMEQIVRRSASILEVHLEDDAVTRLAGACRSTPRIANRLVRSVRDFAQIEQEVVISGKRVEQTMTSLGIDRQGLDTMDRTILQTLIEKFSGCPVGLSTLAAATAEEEQTIEDVYEPYLLQQGYLQRTPKGRVATKQAYDLLGFTMPAEVQSSMFSVS